MFPRLRAALNSLSLNSLQARDDDGEQGNWGPIQIAAPAIVGGVLLLIFAAYIIWQRHPLRKRSYDYRPVRSDWVTKIEGLFVSRRTRLRALHSSAPMTLDDSMRTASLSLDFRRARQYRSGSSDSQTPLTSADDAFDYPPNKRLSDSPPPIPKRRALRWWRLFGSRPQEIKSADPSSRWRVDDPDSSSSGHGQSSHGHEGYHARYAALEAVHEDREEIEDDVIRIGENFGSIESTPMTQHFPEQVRAIQGMSTVQEYSGSSDARTPTLTANAIQSLPSTPVSPFLALRQCMENQAVTLDRQPSVNRGLPPSYDVSQRHIRYASADDIVRLTRSDPPYMVIPPPVRTASSPRVFHGRELSTDSFLAAQPPMVAPYIY